MKKHNHCIVCGIGICRHSKCFHPCFHIFFHKRRNEKTETRSAVDRRVQNKQNAQTCTFPSGLAKNRTDCIVQNHGWSSFPSEENLRWELGAVVPIGLVVNIPVFTASVERTFSALKWIKTYAKNTTGQTRLWTLTVQQNNHTLEERKGNGFCVQSRILDFHETLFL